MDAETELTVYLPAACADESRVREMHERLTRWRPLMEALDLSVDPIMILNEQRQIVLANLAFAVLFQLPEGRSITGQRMGEALACLVAPNTPGGCGTGYGCRKCDLVNAVFSALHWGGGSGSPSLDVRRGAHTELDFHVAVESVESGGDRILFCRIHSGAGMALDFPQDLPGMPADLAGLYRILVSGGPYCPY